MIQTIKNDACVDRIDYRPSYKTICSVSHSPFSGTIDITIWPENLLLEFISFEEWLKTLETKEYTVESFARLIFDELDALFGNSVLLEVTVHAKTDVHASVSASITR